MKAVFVSLALAALVSAQQSNITLIPSGISTDCNKFLVEMNNNAELSACVAPLITATASFNPLSGANLSASDINWSLATMCKPNTGCSDAIVRTWLSRFYASCSPELTNPTTYNSQVRELYDILYVVNPLKGAVCSIDSANQQYCVNQVIGVGANSTGPSGNTTGSVTAPISSAAIAASATAVAGVAASISSAAAAGSAAGASASAASISLSASMAAASAAASSSGSASVSGSASASASSASSVSSVSAASASASATGVATNALFANFATSWSPVQFAADNLFVVYTGATALTKRMIDLLPRQDQTHSNLATVITPNATTYRSTNLPFLFLQPTFGAPKLCTPCTREIMVQYIKWETAVPYALGLAQSPILGGQMELWNSIDKTCGSTYVAAINAQVGQFVGVTNSSSSAMSVLAAPGGNGFGGLLSLAALVGAVAYMV